MFNFFTNNANISVPVIYTLQINCNNQHRNKFAKQKPFKISQILSILV